MTTSATPSGPVPPRTRSGAPGLTISVRVDDGVVLLVVAGPIDAETVAGLRTELLELCVVCPGVLVVDLSAYTAPSDTLLQILQEAQKRSSQRGRCRLLVFAEHPDLAHALDTAGVVRLHRHRSPDEGVPRSARRVLGRL
ncbi:STAS domain-containing protein [Lentzea sp. NPDC034063]|uniref:STAS domain-containing protein n=1 Tax=unclassified Lentzea TaxID=2643253 RepID=UPI0033D312BD